MLSTREISRIKRNMAAEDELTPIVFGALSDSRRYQMFRLLLAHKDLCVTEMAKIFGISVPAASQQLKILEATGLIRRDRMGKAICYGVKCNDPLVKSLLKDFCPQDKGQNIKK